MSAKVTSIKGARKGRGTASKPVDLERIARGVRLILEGIGEDPEREGLQETPRRVAEMYEELTAGMRGETGELDVALSGDKQEEMGRGKGSSRAVWFEHVIAPVVFKSAI